ncbi:MAG: M3 family oligoendopeptidase [Lachnospiraceae bacterium]|nr:M3 family oligoendopeptidase [Lachnospiraceae bacterium]
MNREWSLNIMYKGFFDPAFLKDFETIDNLITESHELAKKLPSMDEVSGVNAILTLKEKLAKPTRILEDYLYFLKSTDTTNKEASSFYDKLLSKKSALTGDDVVFSTFIAHIKDLDSLVKKSPLFSDYEFYLREIKEQASHLLSYEVEDMISKLNLCGGNGWVNLFDYLSSTVKVNYRGETVTLSYIRSLAHHKDATVRKEAYLAEMEAYKSIEGPIAFSLNNIKKQVNLLSLERGFESALDMTLLQSRMKKETLQAIWTAVEEYLPKMREYMKRKGELLGHKNGLPWYDLFAPMGTLDKTYTLEETRDLLLSTLGSFSPDMHKLISRAFDESWIDFYPHPGKLGGAYCEGLPFHGESRILTNFNGSLSDVDTLAHELGHAYHNTFIETHRPLNLNCTAPVAETASMFNENIFMNYAISHAQGEEKLVLLEQLLQQENQTVCDIYSRFLFEHAIFDECKENFLFPERLHEIMVDAQKKTYGDGLDPAYLHPNMWTNKPHYYSVEESYYNFPYAFGGLFSRGLYALYKKEGDSFIPKYQTMLHATTVNTVEDAALLLGVDLTKPDFWRDSLSMISDLVDEFLQLTK